MSIFVDKKNREVIEITQTKASKYLFNNMKKLGLEKIIEFHSSQKIKVDLTTLGLNSTLTATQYCKKYDIDC